MDISSRMLSLLLFVQFHSINCLTIKEVEYKIYSSSSSTNTPKTCAVSYTDNVFVGVRTNKVTGECEGLDYDSGRLGHESGYRYLFKEKVTEMYDPPGDLDGSPQWLIPGYFKPGSKLEFYLTMPTGNWTGFEIDMTDTTDTYLNLHDDVPEVVMFHLMALKSSNDIYIKGYKDASWTIFATMPNLLVEGQIYKMTFTPLTDMMKIYVDDTEVASFAHLTPPDLARDLLFIPYNGELLRLSNITVIFADV